MKETETQIQSVICEYLSLRRVFFWRSNNIPAFNRNSDGSITMRRLPKFTPRGVPDILVLKEGTLYGLEVKRPKTYQSPEQKKFQESIEQNGGIYQVVRSIEDVQRLGL